jgi:hypothetical protein
MKTKKETRGGKRIGAGRKPYVTDKKIQLPMYFLKSEIDLIGRGKIREICKISVENAAFES